VNNSPTIVHAHRIKIHLARPISGVASSNRFVDLSGTDYSGDFEGDITQDGPLVSLRTPHVTIPANAGSSERTFHTLTRSPSDYVAMNGVYAKYFSPPFPARTAIGVAALPLGACVEIDLVVKA